MNKVVMIYVVGCILCVWFVVSLISVQLIKLKVRLLVMEQVKGIIRVVSMVGVFLVILFQVMFLNLCIIRQVIYSSVGVVVQVGIDLVSGVKNIVSRNSIVMISVVSLVCLFVCMFEVFLIQVVVELVFSIELVMIVVELVISVWLRFLF